MHDSVTPVTSADDATTERAELDALLRHMAEHNRSHLRDLRALVRRYEAAGDSRLAAAISESAAAFQHGNEQLEKATQLLDDRGEE